MNKVKAPTNDLSSLAGALFLDIFNSCNQYNFESLSKL
ncbi:hypothetical protein RR47_GL001641 [Enterococcus columbae DSM 7374 = ATCC 51263]|nr:hypothetical protein RR47_GL001641 [Enterococcus columbae DSM 7374 = ATCC 51263]